MRRLLIMGIMLVTTAGLPGTSLAAGPVPGQGPGWTGITKPKDLIYAREMLMVQLEELMKPIDTFTVDKTINPKTITDNAKTISAMLLAVPHLFPPTTNLYDPKVEQPETLALPKIWEQFPAFYAMAEATSNAADSLAHTTGLEALDTGALNLRESCEACHEMFELPYTPPQPSEEALDFDFDSVLKKN